MNSTKKEQNQAFWKKVPPAPIMSIVEAPSGNHYIFDNGRVVTSFDISWDMPYSPESSKVKLFEVFVEMAPINGWKLIGSLKPLGLPMTANICNVREEIPYKVAIRAVDIHSRPGPLSEYRDIIMPKYK